VFDKTGTITNGELVVQSVHSFDTSKYSDEMIHYVSASVEQFANHVISRAIVNSYTNPLSTDVKDVTEIPGKGIVSSVDSHSIAVGNLSFMKEKEIDLTGSNKTLDDSNILISIDGVIAGAITLGDSIKKEAKKSLSRLQALHITDLSIVSGDSEEHVAHVARQCGIDSYYSRQLPQDKLKIVEQKLIKKKKGSFVAFVGDGINDAPVLTVSDVGISMGLVGSQSAIESSDMVIMSDNLEKIPVAIKKSRHAMTIIKENITVAISIKILVMILSLFSLSTLWMAVFADTGVALLAVANSLRILRREDQ